MFFYFRFAMLINIYSYSDYIQNIDIFCNNFKATQRRLEQREGIINYQINNIGHVNLWYKIFNKNPFIIQIPKILSLFYQK